MKMLSWIKALPILILLLIFNVVAHSQVVVERSKEKVTISGIPYYIHQVKKGETSYSISKAYGITVQELTKENPPALYGVKEGQSLRIPVNSVTDVLVSEPLPPVRKKKDESKYIYHNLQPGETVYHLSKNYGVSENDIVLSNPGIDINKLPVGAEIAVPRREFMSSRQKFDDQEKSYTFHKVLKGESLSSIADIYGLSVRELRRENRDLRFPQVGDYIRIPGVKPAEVPVVIPVKPDSVPAVVEVPVVVLEKPVGYTPVKELRGSINVAILLPFYIKENYQRTEIDSSKILKGKRVKKLIRMSDDWIYPRSLDFVEMYEGILLAADTLMSLGLDVNLHTYDIQRDTVEIIKLIKSGALADMDLIIGPVYSHNLSIVAAYGKDLGIPVVSPVTLVNNTALVNNPTLFMANSSLEVAQKALAKKVSEYSEHNFVFIHADTIGIDEDVKRFKNLIFTELSDKLPYEAIKFKEFLFYSRSMFDNDSINKLGHALSEQSKNIVIIASEDAPVINETIQDIQGLSKKFDIKVFGYPALRDIENLDPKYLFDLDIMVYYPDWLDYSKSDVKKFNANFRKKFLTEPVEKSYAWQGYDIAYYFFTGIAIHGKDFLEHPEIHNPDLLQTEYTFVKKNPGDGFENQKLYIIRYTRDYEVKLVEENSVLQQK